MPRSILRQPVLPDLALGRLRGGEAPSGADELSDWYLVTRAYDAASAKAEGALRGWAKTVGKGKRVTGFGRKAQALIEEVSQKLDAVEAKSEASTKMLSERREQLLTQLEEDVRELFGKQRRLLTTAEVSKYKSNLLRVMGRAGVIADWQLEALRKSAERSFDAACDDLLVEGVIDSTRAQLTTAFSKHITDVTAKHIESSGMQLEKLGAMSRAASRMQKPPRGIRTGLGLVLSLKNQLFGGQGNVQGYTGYTSGLNSMHVQYSNDQDQPDSTGAKPPALRWQPKLNFDISL